MVGGFDGLGEGPGEGLSVGATVGFLVGSTMGHPVPWSPAGDGLGTSVCRLKQTRKTSVWAGGKHVSYEEGSVGNLLDFQLGFVQGHVLGHC